MHNISDLIEHYLKHMLRDSSAGAIEIQRNHLAGQFSCVPSQINYVIRTRFTLEKGYVVMSKRGGRGYIRIQRVDLPTQQKLHHHICESIGERIDYSVAEGIIYQLKEEQFITDREENLLRVAILQDNFPVKYGYCAETRAKLLKSMLLTLLHS